MRILSQDGKIDFLYENFSLSITQDNCIVATRDVVASMEEILTGVVAKYNTEEKAKKAMEMLRKAYAGLPIIMQNVEFTEDVAEMFNKWQKQGIIYKTSDDEPSKIECVNNGYFQFPADEEIEVWQ